MYWSYESCMEAAGATLHDSQSFGSYQGASVALVTYEGRSGFVFWDFGSCSGCDYLERWRCDFHDDPTDEDAAKFGKDYLDDILGYEKAVERASRHADWSSEDADMLQWVKDHRETFEALLVKPAIMLPPVEDDNE